MDKNTPVTLQTILNNNPCRRYSTMTKLLEVTGNRSEFPISDVLELDISTEDKIWVLTLPELMSYAERLDFVQRLETLARESRHRTSLHAKKRRDDPQLADYVERVRDGETRLLNHPQSLAFTCYMEVFSILVTEFISRNGYAEDYEPVYDEMILTMLSSYINQ